MMLLKTHKIPAGATLALAALSSSKAAPRSKCRPAWATIVIELDAEKAPLTVKNFLQIREGWLLQRHDLSPRHRRLHDPGRRFTKDMGEKPTGAQIPTKPRTA
jgi:hypothetical protein